MGPTYGGPLSHLGRVGAIQELWLVVIDILDFDDELGLRFHQTVGVPVPGLGPEGVVGLLFPIQPSGGVNVPCALIDAENRRSAFTGQDVSHLAVTFIHIRVELQKKGSILSEDVRDSEGR